MSSGDSIDKQIEDAITSGDLTPTRGVGQPIENLDPDPMWWAKSLMRREKASDGLGDVIDEHNRRLALAIDADSLEQAREILASANNAVSTWNQAVDPEFAIEIRDEIWLLTERENARR